MRVKGCRFSALVIGLALLPAVSAAQTVERGLLGTRSDALPATVIDSAPQPAADPIARSLSESMLERSQEAKGRPSTRGRNMAIGAAIGAAVGVVVGEYGFGQAMDVPHGLDMLLGAGIGIGIGVGLAALLSGAGRDGSLALASSTSVTVVPVVSPSRKALFVTVPLR